MDGKHSNLGRPPPRLRYFNSNERTCSYQKANIVRNIEDCFNELDSSSDTGSELSALSPLPKTRALSGEAEAEALSIMLLPVKGTSEAPVCSETNPPEEFAPEITSSPAGLAAENGDGHGEERVTASLLLFENEAGGPDIDAGKIALSKKAQLTRKDIDESSEGEIESPPKKIVLGKQPKSPAGGKQQRKASSPCSSDEEFLSLQSKMACVAPVSPSRKSPASDEMRAGASKDYEGGPSGTAVKSKELPHIEKDGSDTVTSKDRPLNDGRKCSAFALKLKDTGLSKSIGKETSPVPVSPPSDAADDFVILEDEYLQSQRWFSIPRRTEFMKKKLPQEDREKKEDGEGGAVKHVEEGNAAQGEADENQDPPQNSKKQKHSKGIKSRKTSALTPADQKTKGKKMEGVAKRALDVPVTVQSESPHTCLEGQGEAAGHTEPHTADTAAEDAVPSPSSASRIETYEPAVKRNKKTVGKQKEKCPTGSRRKSLSQKDEKMVPSSRPVTESSAAPEGHKRGDRKRRKPVSDCLVNHTEQTNTRSNEIHSSLAEKKTKLSKAPGLPETVPSSAAEQALGQDVDSMQPGSTSDYGAGQKTHASKKKSGRGRHSRQVKKTVTNVLGLLEDCEEGVANRVADDQGYSDPSPYPEQHHPPAQGNKQKKSKEKQSGRHSEKPVNRETDVVGSGLPIPEVGKRKRRQPGSWWLVNQEEEAGNEGLSEVPVWHEEHRIPDQPHQSTSQSHARRAQSPLLEKEQDRVPHIPLEGAESVKSSPLHHHQKTLKKRTAAVLPKPRRAPKSSRKASKKSSAGTLSSGKLTDKIRKNSSLTPRNVKTSLTCSGSLFTPDSSKTTPYVRRSASRKTVGFPVTELPYSGKQHVSSSHGRRSFDYDQGTSDYCSSDQNGNSVSAGPGADISPNCPNARSLCSATYVRRSGTRNLAVDDRRMSQFEVDVCNGFKSGPSSMIEVDKNTVPSLQNVPHALSEFLMCGPPLRPVALQAEDRQNLITWLGNVWSSPDGARVVTPEHFQWYESRGRIMGYSADLLYQSFSNGKILLGSYMKKPLQVDNNAIYVYNILTSTVRVTISGAKMDLSSGETFMIPCGHAYGIQNVTATPAMLLYHRMAAESPDSAEEEQCL